MCILDLISAPALVFILSLRAATFGVPVSGMPRPVPSWPVTIGRFGITGGGVAGPEK